MRKLEQPNNQHKKPRELADALGVAYETVVGYCREGDIKTIRVGKLYRIPMEEYNRVLREGIPPAEAVA